MYYNRLKFDDIKTLLEEDQKFQELLIIKNPKTKTRDIYKVVMKQYILVTGLTPTQLINEAEEEEDKGVKLRNRKIKTYLLNFIQYLRKKNFEETSISNYITYIKMFYKTFDIIIPRLPVKLKRFPKKDYKEWITKEDIKKALRFSNKKFKAIILLMASSGMGSAEIRNLKFEDFLHSIKEYLKYPLRQPYTVDDIKKSLSDNQHVIPTWEIQRVKTEEYYYTFSSPESVNAILDYLEDRESKNQPITGDHEPLFMGQIPGTVLSESGLATVFQKINQNAGFKKIGNKGYFTSHELRRFFTDQAYKSHISEREVKWLRGQKTKDTFNRYTKPDPEILKLEYIEKALPCLSMERVKIREIDENAYQRLKKLEKENFDLKKKLNEERNESSKQLDYIKRKLEELEDKQNSTEELLGNKNVRDELNKREK